MSRSFSLIPLTGAAALAGVLLAGCASNEPPARSMGRFDAPARPAQPVATPQRAVATPARNDYSLAMMAFPTGDPDTSALGVERILPEYVLAGQTFEYELSIQNLTTLAQSDVKLMEAPSGMRILGGSPEPTMSADMATWSIGTLAPREKKVIRVQAEPVGETRVGSCATVSYRTSLCTDAPVLRPDLRLVLNGPDVAMVCDPVELVATVTNTGTAPLSPVEVRAELPAGLTTMDGRREVRFDAGTLAPGESRTYPIAVKATGAGEARAVATARGTRVTADADPVEIMFVQPRLEVEMVCSSDQYLGRGLSYDIVVRNVGDGVARNAMVTQNIGNTGRFATATRGGNLAGDSVVWALGAMQPGDEITLRSTAEPGAIGAYEASVAASADCADRVVDSCTTNVKGIPAILLEVVDLVDPLPVGEDTTYVVTVTNQGSANDTNVRLVGTLEDTQRAMSVSSGRIAGRQIEFANVPVLRPGQVVTFRVVVRGVSAGDVRFAVEMISDQLTRPVNETEATNIYE